MTKEEMEKEFEDWQKGNNGSWEYIPGDSIVKHIKEQSRKAYLAARQKGEEEIERLKDLNGKQQEMLDLTATRINKAEARLETERVSVNELSLALQKSEEKVKELEATLASIKVDTSIGKLVVKVTDNDWP